MIKEKIKVPIYNAGILLIIADDFGSAMGDYAEEDYEKYFAVTIPTTPFNYIVGFEKEALCHMIVSHEACHLAHRIMNDAGLEHTLLNDEAEAYLQGYIVNEIYKVIKTNKLMCYEKQN